jgi:hypothetical protein
MNVQETVFVMMRAYPMLYPTRVRALARLFDSFDCSWVNGELIDHERVDPESARDFLPYKPEDVTETGDAKKDQYIVHNRWENAKAQFVYDNAHLMSADRYSEFRKHSTIRFGGRHFADIPADVTADWLDAAKELAMAVSTHQYFPDRTYAPDHLTREREELENSAKLCTQFLERFAVITPCPFERAARLEKVTREAQALGFALVPAEATPAEGAASPPAM